MVFSSIVFLFYFLPALLVLYAIAPKRLKNLVLLLASLTFYAWGEVRFLFVMLILSGVDFLCGRAIDKHRHDSKKVKLYWLIDVGANLSVLLFFKYADFFLGNANLLFGLDLPLLGIPLPIGVSFNTFQSISYITDVKRQTTKSEPSYYNYLTYTTLFPQIIAGPIVRYVTVENELEFRQLRIDNAVLGLKRFLIGLGKKVLLANNIGLLWEAAQNVNISEASVLFSWMGVIAFAFQIYFDFSGYSDMAIGLARILGMYFDENFNYPYISKSITEFWRRWHMTLSAWFRDYVYIPLGGNRKGKWVMLRNMLIVWGLTGFWHGASWNFLLWGVYFGILLAVEKFVLAKLLSKAPSVVSHLYTCFFVLIGWVLFNFEDMGKMGTYFACMFGVNTPFYNAHVLYYVRNNAFLLIVSALCCTPFFKRLSERVKRLRTVDALSISGYTALFFVTIAYLVNSTYNPFLYFRF
jgi:alginate O-acetyltransferase complex protein AlgI